jgi:cell wall-associated NlpC family hydrolase
MPAWSDSDHGRGSGSSGAERGGAVRAVLAAGVGAAAVVIGLPLTLLVVLVASLAGAGGASGAPQDPTAGATDGPSSIAGIPAPYLTDLEQAGARYDVPWTVLAGIYYEECDFGQSQLAGCNPPGTENSAGAQGPGQFLPTTWRKGLAPYQLIPPGPPTTSNDQGYATDGDGDGVADPWDPADATAATARLLAASGASTGNLTAAVFAYNHSTDYVDAVLAQAAKYQQEAQAAGAATPASTTSAGGGTGGGSGGEGDQQAISVVLAFAEAQLGLPYAWGGSGPGSWDCSGLVQAAFAQVGVAFTHDAAAQYAATAADAVPISSNLPAGDLVFFGPSLAGIEHVGIVIGGGQMIDAPHTGAFVRQESYDWSDLIAATQPL